MIGDLMLDLRLHVAYSSVKNKNFVKTDDLDIPF